MQVELGQLQVARPGDLEIKIRARHNSHRKTSALDQRSLVGAHKSVRLRLGKGLLQQPIAKALRRLRQHDELTRNRRGNQRPVRGPLDLLNGVDGRKADNCRTVFDNRIDSPLDCGRIDQRAHRVVNQDNIVRLGGQSSQRVGDGLLTVIPAFNNANPVGKAILGNLGLNALHLGFAHGHIDRRNTRRRSKGAQRMNQDGDAIEREKLLGLRPGHPGSEPCGWKNHEYMHNGWSITAQTAQCAGIARNSHAKMFFRQQAGQPPYHFGMRTVLPIDTTFLKPGLRLAVGLSGGADSVALTRALAARSKELGLVLHAAHLHHGLRGEEADGDLAFARALAAELDLPFHETHVNAADAAKGTSAKSAESIEEAARRLRYGWFRELMASGEVEAVATAHTRDDQAETVLSKFLRGAWTEGLSGIHPVVEFPEGRILRPMLGTTRAEVEAYLGALGQGWREDSTNSHLTFTRNRIRHELLPQLEGWNPQLREHLAQMAQLAHDEEDWWQAELARLAPQLILPGLPVRGGGRAGGDGLALSIDVTRLAALTVALQRRLLRYAAAQLGATLDFSSTEALRSLARAGRAGQKLQLASGLAAERSHRELRMSNPATASAEAVAEYAVSVPGEVAAPAFNLRLRIEVGAPATATEGLTATLRNWRPGDRVQPRHSSGPRKAKEVLERLRVTGSSRKVWPVLEIDGHIAWMKGIEVESTPGISILATSLEDAAAQAEPSRG
jgi:tRNA(Ile)-lysidine synthase